MVSPRQLQPYPAATLEVTPSEIPSTGPTLAFLKDGDIWLLDEPGGQPYPLSITGDIISYTWAPGGERLAAFNGKTFCFINRDGSVRTACLDLGLNETPIQDRTPAPALSRSTLGGAMESD